MTSSCSCSQELLSRRCMLSSSAKASSAGLPAASPQRRDLKPHTGEKPGVQRAAHSHKVRGMEEAGPHTGLK